MAYKDVRFDTGFENWLDTTLDRIKTENKGKVDKQKQQQKTGLVSEGVKKKYSTFGDCNSDNYSSDKEDGLNNNQKDTATAQNQSQHIHRGYEPLPGENKEVTFNSCGPLLLADDLAHFEYELIDDEWEELATSGDFVRAPPPSNMSQQQREQIRQDGFQSGGQFYTTVWGLEEDDDDANKAARNREEYPQTPSTRERVARILRETELADHQNQNVHRGGGSSGSSRTQNRPDFNSKFDSVNYQSVKHSASGDDVDSWSLEDEPPVTALDLDPSRLPYVHREAGDGKEHPGTNRDPIYKPNRNSPGDLDDNRNSQLSGSLDEFMDAQETLEDSPDGIDIKTPQGKGRALLPMEDLELSFEDESDETILDVAEEEDDEYGGTITIRPIRDSQPIIMDGSELRQLALKRRRRARVCIYVTLAVLGVGVISLIAYLTVHFSRK